MLCKPVLFGAPPPPRLLLPCFSLAPHSLSPVLTMLFLDWSNEIATAAYNGHIVLWDMDSLSKEQKQKEVLTGQFELSLLLAVRN